MKFITSKTSLLDAVTLVGKCVSTSTVLPILESLLFSVADGQLTVTASDLHTTMSTVVNVESQDTGRIAVPSRILLEVLKTLPEQPIRFVIDDTTFAIEITAGDGSFNLAGENAENFPKIPVVETPSTVELPAPILADAISKTLFAVSNDELRPAMTGVFCALTPDAMTFVSTDAAKLVRYIRLDTGSVEATSFILPKKALVLLKAALPVDDVKVAVEYNQTSAFFHFGNVSVICRLIDEKYPAYESIIPKDNPSVMTIDRISFINVLQRVAIFSNKTNHQVKLEVANNKLTITGEDADFANRAKDVTTCSYAGDEMAIGFNAKLLLEILKNMDTHEVAVKMSQPNKPALLVPVDGNETEDLLMLVMPLLLNDHQS